MRRLMLLTLLALALPTAVLANSTPIIINFSVAPNQQGFGEPFFIGTSLQNSTAFNLGTGPFVVNGDPGAGDQSGLNAGDPIKLSPKLLVYGTGNSGSLVTPLTKSWTDGLGSFSETLTKFTADRNLPNAIQLSLSGSLTTPGGVTESIVAILSANQAGGDDNLVRWTLTEEATGVTPVPEPGTLGLLELGLLGNGVLGLAVTARRKLKLGR